MDTYTPQEFSHIVNLEPHMLSKQLYVHLEKEARRIEGTCKPGVGYIKKGTIKIVKKTLGKAEGNHFTGNVTYHLRLSCLAAHPKAGQFIQCFVSEKNEIGIFATNYELPAYNIFITKMLDDESSIMDQVQRNNYVEVEVVDFKLRASDQADHIKSSYWVICKLINIHAENRFQSLPQITDAPLLTLKLVSFDMIASRFTDIAGEIYEELNDTKHSCQRIRDSYHDMIREHPELVDKDPLLAGTHKSKYVIGYADSVNTSDKVKSVHTINILHTNIVDDKYESGKKISLIVSKCPVVDSGRLVLYYNVKPEQDTAGGCRSLDFWSQHVKYIINPHEMVHATSTYMTHLEKLIRTSGGTTANRIAGPGRRKKVEMKTSSGHVLATLIEKDTNIINRAYYKMREIAKVFPNILLRRNMVITCLAESPGGFIQALLDMRIGTPASAEAVVDATSTVGASYKDSMTGLSISIDGSTWGQLEKKINTTKYKAADVKSRMDLFGDQEGNVLSLAVRQKFYKRTRSDLITADGGFEHDKTANTEELEMHPLILAEITMALNNQQEGGSFVIKIYDLATDFTVDMVQILCYAYESVGIFKPKMSRSANSEKYLICQNFQLSEAERTKLVGTLEQFLQHDRGDEDKFGSIVAVPNPPLRNAIFGYNAYFMKKQIDFIEGGEKYSRSYIDALKADNIKMISDDVLARTGTQKSVAEDFITTVLD